MLHWNAHHWSSNSHRIISVAAFFIHYFTNATFKHDAVATTKLNFESLFNYKMMIMTQNVFMLVLKCHCYALLQTIHYACEFPVMHDSPWLCDTTQRLWTRTPFAQHTPSDTPLTFPSPIISVISAHRLKWSISSVWNQSHTVLIPATYHGHQSYRYSPIVPCVQGI